MSCRLLSIWKSFLRISSGWSTPTGHRRRPLTWSWSQRAVHVPSLTWKAASYLGHWMWHHGLPSSLRLQKFKVRCGFDLAPSAEDLPWQASPWQLGSDMATFCRQRWIKKMKWQVLWRRLDEGNQVCAENPAGKSWNCARELHIVKRGKDKTTLQRVPECVSTEGVVVSQEHQVPPDACRWLISCATWWKGTWQFYVSAQN